MATWQPLPSFFSAMLFPREVLPLLYFVHGIVLNFAYCSYNCPCLDDIIECKDKNILENIHEACSFLCSTSESHQELFFHHADVEHGTVLIFYPLRLRIH